MLTDTAAVTMGMNSAFALEMMTRCPSAEGATGASMDQVHVDQDSQWRDDKPINSGLGVLQRFPAKCDESKKTLHRQGQGRIWLEPRRGTHEDHVTPLLLVAVLSIGHRGVTLTV
ncbi:MAG: hypothetical protein ACQEXC_12015 [Pseudomonadota bacterium]